MSVLCWNKIIKHPLRRDQSSDCTSSLPALDYLCFSKGLSAKLVGYGLCWAAVPHVILRIRDRYIIQQNSHPQIPWPFVRTAVVVELGCLIWVDISKMTFIADWKKNREKAHGHGLQTRGFLMTFLLEAFALSVISFQL